MRDFLVEQGQPFGQVSEVKVMPGAPCDYGYSAKGLGDVTVRENHGVTHAPSFSDPNPGALKQAHRDQYNPFGPTGHPHR